MLLHPNIEAVGDNIELGHFLVKPDKPEFWIKPEVFCRAKDVCVIGQ